MDSKNRVLASRIARGGRLHAVVLENLNVVPAAPATRHQVLTPLQTHTVVLWSTADFVPFSHPLGLPMFLILHDNNPNTLSFLLERDGNKAFTDCADAASENNKLDDILETAVEEWVEKFPTKKSREEFKLTKLMSTMIEEEYIV